MKKISLLTLIAFGNLALVALSSPPTAAVTENTEMYWTPVTQAQVKLDDKTPLKWNLYEPAKSDRPSAKDKEKPSRKDPDIVLVLIGRRFLLLDIKNKLVYGVALADLQAKGADFESANLLQADRVLPSSDWAVRDIGPAESVRLTLGDYGRTLDVQISHPPDLRAFY